MNLSESSVQKLENFFREYLADESFALPKIHFYTGRVSAIFTRLIKVHGITVGRHIFILPALLKPNSSNLPKLPENLVAHEIAHVLQYRRDGFFVFLYRYTRDYYRNLSREKVKDEDARARAYLNIPYEIEAREIAAEFCRRNRL